MKHLKKLLSVSLGAVLVLGMAATAQAKGYSVAGGDVYVGADANGQYVAVGSSDSSAADPSPVIGGLTDKNSVSVLAEDGATAWLSLSGLTASSNSLPSVILDPTEGKIVLGLRGTNNVTALPGNEVGGLLIQGSGADKSSVSVKGTGSLVANVSKGVAGTAVYVDGADVSIDGGSVSAVSPDGYGVGLYNGSTLSVSEDYLHPAAVTVQGGLGCFDIDSLSQLLIGGNNFILDEHGRDITAKVLENPEILKTIKFIIIATKDIAVFPSGDMKSSMHLMTCYKNITFEQTGEPSAEAMKLLSEGMKGEALYSASFAFTDNIENHGKFQLNFVLPKLAGHHVKLVTLEDGKAVSYDRWVSNAGIFSIHVDHLGDFAVFDA